MPSRTKKFLRCATVSGSEDSPLVPAAFCPYRKVIGSSARAARRRNGPLPRARMPAAGVRPQPARMVFARIALLQQDAAAIIEHEDRERAMQAALAMDRLLGGGAERAVALVDQDQGLVSPLRCLHWSFPKHVVSAFPIVCFSNMLYPAAVTVVQAGQRTWSVAIGDESMRKVSAGPATQPDAKPDSKTDPMSNPIGAAAAPAGAAARSNVDPRIAYDDLRQWIEEARKLGELKEVQNLSWQRDIGMVAEMALH